MQKEKISVLIISLSLALGAAPTVCSQSQVRIIQPALVRQGETFTGMVVEETATGEAPLESGQVVFHGQVLPIEAGGKVTFPAFVKEAGSVLVGAQVVRSSNSSPVALPLHHFEVVDLAANLPTRIANVPEVLSPGGRLQLTGQGFDAVQKIALMDRNGAQIALGGSVGSSLQRFAVVPRSLAPGTYRLVAWDAAGTRYEAPNPSRCPSLKLEGARIRHRGQRGTITVLSDVDGTVLLSGGEPQIILDQRTIAVHAGEPRHVKFTAQQTGNYEAKALLVDPDDVAIPLGGQPVDLRLEPLQAWYDVRANQTIAGIAVRVLKEDGDAAARVHVDVAIASPHGVEYGRGVSNQQGWIKLARSFSGQIAAGAFSFHVFRVPGHEWDEGQEPGQDLHSSSSSSACGYQDEKKKCDCKCTVTYPPHQQAIQNITVQASDGVSDMDGDGKKLTQEQKRAIERAENEITGWIKVSYALAEATVTTTGQGEPITVTRHTSVGITKPEFLTAWLAPLYRRTDQTGYDMPADKGMEYVDRKQIECPDEATFTSRNYEVYIALLTKPDQIELRVKDFFAGCNNAPEKEQKVTVNLTWNAKGKLTGAGVAGGKEK